MKNTNEAMRLLNHIHARYTEALIAGKTPDFNLFEEFREIAKSFDAEPEIQHCLDCAAKLEVNKSVYIRLFINQVNVCNGNGEDINTHLSNREVYLCQKCSANIVQFTKPSAMPETKETKEGK